jgi:hypothetical protein
MSGKWLTCDSGFDALVEFTSSFRLPATQEAGFFCICAVAHAVGFA